MTDGLGTPEVGPVLAAMQAQAAMHGAQLCALGFHAWLPWVPIRAGAEPCAQIVRYETYCGRCRHPEQFTV